MNEDVNTATDGSDKDIGQMSEEKISSPTVRLTMDKRIELAVSVVVILYGIFLIVEAMHIDEGMMPDPVTSRGMPLYTGIFILIGGIILTIVRLMTWSMMPGHFVLGEGHEDEEGYPASCLRAFSIVLAAWISLWLMKPMGYLIATPLFLFAGLWAMGKRSWWGLIGFPVIYTLLTWYIFSQPLQVILPLGFMTPYFRSLGLVP